MDPQTILAFGDEVLGGDGVLGGASNNHWLCLFIVDSSYIQKRERERTDEETTLQLLVRASCHLIAQIPDPGVFPWAEALVGKYCVAEVSDD
jgi:hypothetical protein